MKMRMTECERIERRENGIKNARYVRAVGRIITLVSFINMVVVAMASESIAVDQASVFLKLGIAAVEMVIGYIVTRGGDYIEAITW